MRLARVVFLLLLPALAAGCEKKPPVSPPGADAPLDLTSMIAACEKISDCERACSDGQGAACVTAGHYHEYGRGVPKDAAKAYAFYEKACEKSNPTGCYNQGLLVEVGRGVEKDVERAKWLYAKVCGMGSRTACARLEDLSRTSTKS